MTSTLFVFCFEFYAVQIIRIAVVLRVNHDVLAGAVLRVDTIHALVAPNERLVRSREAQRPHVGLHQRRIATVAAHELRRQT